MKITVIILAAGQSKRMGRDKLQMKYKGKTLLQHTIDLAQNLPADEKLIVTTKDKQKNTHKLPTYINEHPEDGISGSIHIGISHATGTQYLFLNADQPDLTADDIIPLIELARKNPEKIIYPEINGKPCSPTIFPSIFREQLLQLKGDTGGRTIRDNNPEQCICHIPKHPERFSDINIPQEIAACRSQ